MVRATIICPKEYVGPVMGLCHEKRGTSVGMEYLSPKRVQLTYDMPLGEVITDFFDALKSRTKGYAPNARAPPPHHRPPGGGIPAFFAALKSRTKGYASYDYDRLGYEPADLVKVEVLVSGDPVEAPSIIVHRAKAYYRGRALVEKLKELIPRQNFEVPVQAAVGRRVIARETGDR